jgi:RNA polymerase sigma-70 factor (ECF subfamily)
MRDLFEENARRIYALARRMIGDHEEALDVTQETFLRAVRNRRQLKPGLNISGWLIRVARNLCIDRLRARRRQRSASLDAVGAGQIADDSALQEPAARSMATERQEQLEAALERLAPDHREILILRDIMDLSYQQVAETLDVPLGTVMSRLHRARAMLRKELGDDPHAL